MLYTSFMFSRYRTYMPNAWSVAERSNRTKRRLRVVYCLALVLLSNALMPIAASANGLDNQIGKVLLCTSNGFQWVDVDTPSQSDTSAASNHCVFCLNSDDDLDAIFIVSASVPLLNTRTTLLDGSLDAWEAKPLVLHAQPRAPPVFL